MRYDMGTVPNLGSGVMCLSVFPVELFDVDVTRWAALESIMRSIKGFRRSMDIANHCVW